MIRKIVVTFFLLSVCPFLFSSYAQEPVLPPDMTPAQIQKQTEEAKREYEKAERAAKKAEEDRINAEYKAVRKLEDLEDQKIAGKKVKGSCDVIARESTCIEFFGSIWTYDTMRMSCQGNGGTFSTKPCPRNFFGGCNAGVGTMSDMVTWFYFQGNGGFNKASEKNARNSCSSFPGIRWIQGRSY